MKKIFLTGATGFIGRNILESYLTKKYNFIAPSQEELDLTDSEKVKKFIENHKPDVIIHAATKTAHRNTPDVRDIFLTDARMFLNIIRNSRYFKKMIYFSSGAAYGLDYPLVKVKEDFYDTYVPTQEMAFNKYAIEKYIELINNIEIVSFRIFGIFGKYEVYAIRFISNVICKTIFDLPITIKQNRKMDYLYIDDLMPILEYFIENKPKYKAYNITPDESVELYALAERIREISKKNLPIKVGQTGMGLEYTGDNTRLKEEIPYLKFTPIDEAIKKLYKWYLENKHLIKKEFLMIDK